MTVPRGCPIQDGRRMKQMQVVFHFMYLIDKDAAIVHQTLEKFSAFFFSIPSKLKKCLSLTCKLFKD